MLEGICDFGPELIISGAMYRGDLNDKQHDHVTVSCDILLAPSPYGEVHFFPAYTQDETACILFGASLSEPRIQE